MKNMLKIASCVSSDCNYKYLKSLNIEMHQLYKNDLKSNKSRSASRELLDSDISECSRSGVPAMAGYLADVRLLRGQ